jgi:hypothetical protein
MADLQDVSTYLKAQAVAAVYPNGTSQPSIASMDVRIFEGWPLPELLDADLGGYQLFNGSTIPRPNGRAAQVSVFPFGASVAIPSDQILDNTYVIVPPVHGMTVSLGSDSATLTINGAPASVNEYVTIVVANQFVASAAGPTVANICANLAAQLSLNVPGVTYTTNTVVIPNQVYTVAAVGTQATLGKVTHKQNQTFMISIWAPDHVSRQALAAAIDNKVKQNLRVSMPDTSQALVKYQRTMQDDVRQPLALYRRDLFFNAEYATVFQFPGYEITSLAATISELQNLNLPYYTFPQVGQLLPAATGITPALLPTAPAPSVTQVI